MKDPAAAGSGILTHTITNEGLVQAGYFSLSDRYESLQLCDGSAVYGTVRTAVREDSHAAKG